MGGLAPARRARRRGAGASARSGGRGAGGAGGGGGGWWGGAGCSAWGASRLHDPAWEGTRSTADPSWYPLGCRPRRLEPLLHLRGGRETGLLGNDLAVPQHDEVRDAAD